MIIKFYGTGTYDLQRKELGNAESLTVKSFQRYWENGDSCYILRN